MKDLENCVDALALALSSLPLGLRQEEGFLAEKPKYIVLITLGSYRGNYIDLKLSFLFCLQLI